jgi:hypothetical protein
MSIILPDRLIERVETYVAHNPEATRAEVLGRFQLSPDEESDERELVEQVLAGEVERADAARGAADSAEVEA